MRVTKAKSAICFEVNEPAPVSFTFCSTNNKLKVIAMNHSLDSDGFGMECESVTLNKEEAYQLIKFLTDHIWN